jgi:hypothetical protein
MHCQIGAASCTADFRNVYMQSSQHIILQGVKLDIELVQCHQIFVNAQILRSYTIIGTSFNDEEDFLLVILPLEHRLLLHAVGHDGQT